MFKNVKYKGKTYTFDNVLRYRGTINKLDNQVTKLSEIEQDLVMLYNDTDSYYTNIIVNK